MLGEKRKVEKSAYRMLPKYNGGQVQGKTDISIPKGTRKEGITNPKHFWNLASRLLQVSRPGMNPLWPSVPPWVPEVILFLQPVSYLQNSENPRASFILFYPFQFKLELFLLIQHPQNRCECPMSATGFTLLNKSSLADLSWEFHLYSGFCWADPWITCLISSAAAKVYPATPLAFSPQDAFLIAKPLILASFVIWIGWESPKSPSTFLFHLTVLPSIYLSSVFYYEQHFA